MDRVRLTMDDIGTSDPLFGVETGFDPDGDLIDKHRTDPSIPGELRKILNNTEPEMQNIYNPIFDDASREKFINDNELKTKLFEAKWNWKKERTYG